MCVSGGGGYLEERRMLREPVVDGTKIGEGSSVVVVVRVAGGESLFKTKTREEMKGVGGDAM